MRITIIKSVVYLSLAPRLPIIVIALDITEKLHVELTHLGLALSGPLRRNKNLKKLAHK